MCLWKERRYSVQKNTFADNSGPFVFPKTAALTPTQIVSVFVGLHVGEFISNRPFFPFWCLARLSWIFNTAVSWQSKRDPGHTRKWSTQGVQDLTTPRRHSSSSGQGVFLWKRLDSLVCCGFCGFLSPPVMIHVLKMAVSGVKIKFVISTTLHGIKNIVCFADESPKACTFITGHLLDITVRFLSKCSSRLSSNILYLYEFTCSFQAAVNDLAVITC